MTVKDSGLSGELCYAICAPDGPSTPFALPDIVWIDSLRLLVMVMGVVLIVVTPRLVLRAEALGQQMRLAGQGFFALIVIGTEVGHLGDDMHYRLVLSLLGISLLLWGAWRMRYEVPPRTRPEHRTRE